MSRGVSPVIGVVLLIAITVIGATAVGFTVSQEPPSPAPTATFELSVDAGADRLTLKHQRGDEIDLSSVRFRVTVDGEELSSQPPVPFFSAEGFESGPTGPFNSASPDHWRVGQTGTLTLASTNEPEIEAGDRVAVAILTDDTLIVEVETTAVETG